MEMKYDVLINGDRIQEEIEVVSPPAKEAFYWQITLKGGGIIQATGQVVVRCTPKT